MKVFAVLLLALGVLCHSMLALAEGPIPFRELSRTAAVPLLSDAQTTPAPVSAPATPARPMTQGGKVMTGVGIGFVGIGGALMGMGIAGRKGWFGGTVLAIGVGAGAGFAGIGTGLIVVGVHRRSAK